NGTLNIASAAQKRKAAQLVFASSEWVYGDVRNDEVQLEDRPIDVTAMKSEYALTKIVGEQCLKLSGTQPAVTVLRFGIVYGPRRDNWSAVENLFNAVRTQEEVKVGAVKTARRFIHVDDIVTGILACRGRSGFEVFNLSGDRPVSLGEVIETSAKLLNRRVKVVETNPTQPSIRNPDNAKARAQLNWQPAIDLKTGLSGLRQFLEST
ncbi:MAG: NAD(P)-dependent oxidoreductase, partial [Nitrospirota bacterium]